MFDWRSFWMPLTLNTLHVPLLQKNHFFLCSLHWFIFHLLSPLLCLKGAWGQHGADLPVKIDLETLVEQSSAITVLLILCLWNNLTQSALSEVIRGRLDSLLMGWFSTVRLLICLSISSPSSHSSVLYSRITFSCCVHLDKHKYHSVYIIFIPEIRPLVLAWSKAWRQPKQPNIPHL